MTPLLSRKVRRGETLAEWEPSDHQSTLDGLLAFKARQESRRIMMQTAFTAVKVRAIKGKA